MDSISAISPQLQLPAKTHVETAQVSVFGSVFGHNPMQYATLETAQMLAAQLGGTVVDSSTDWGGGAQSPEYQIKIGDNVMLNAGLIAARCETCGVEMGLNAARQEIALMTGRPVVPMTPSVVGPIDAVKQPAAAAPVVAAVAPTPAAAPVAQTTQPQEQATKVESAAKQFESLVVSQLLKDMRESSQGAFFGDNEEHNNVTAVEFAEQALAQSIASNGGLGLSKLLIEGLQKQSS